MRLSIDGQLFATAVRVPGWVNGYAQPVFTTAERSRILAECVRLGWDAPNDDYDGTPSMDCSGLGMGECRMITLAFRFAVIFGSLAGVGVWALYLSWLAKGGRGRFEVFAWRVVRGVFDSAR
jgi:hypothetical protein